MHDTWILERRLRWHAPAKLKNFNERKKTDEDGILELLDHLPKWTKVDRIIWKEYGLPCLRGLLEDFNILRNREVDDDVKYYVKWTDLGYSECTWELSETVKGCANGPEEIDAFEQREERARAHLTLAIANRKKEPKKEKRSLFLFCYSVEFNSCR